MFPASAQQRVFQVTMSDGTVCTVTTTGGLPSVGCPGVVGVIESIVEVTPPAPDVPTPDPVPSPAPTPGGDDGGQDDGSFDAGGDEPRPAGGDEPKSQGDGKRQKTTGAKKQADATHDAEGEVEGAHRRRGKKDKEADKRKRGRMRDAGGAPTLDNPTLSLAQPGPAPIGVPNFFIDKFRIPPFLLSIYQAAGIEYGVRWEVLAAINEIETDYG
ncbi:MAG TPA: hypothetical protein VF587_09345, partial [Solirubrobacteraceae bacterium]